MSRTLPRNISALAAIMIFCYLLGAPETNGNTSMASIIVDRSLEAQEWTDSDLPALPPPPAPIELQRPVVAKHTPPASLWRRVSATVTAYCPCRRCCGKESDGVTSTGTSAWRRGAATDPRAIPYGSVVDVPGYGKTTVDDTGGAMRQGWRRGRIVIDVRTTYHWQARKWGRKKLTVLVRK